MIKRTMALGAAVAITGAAAISCDNPSWAPNDQSKTSPENTADSAYTDPTTGPRGEISFLAQHIRSHHPDGLSYDPAVISSRADFLEYISAPLNGRVGLSAPEYPTTAPYYEFKQSVEKYTDGFFATKFLVIVPKTEGSGSNSHKVSGVNDDGTIYIERIVPAISTDDIAEWFIIIEMDNSYRLPVYNAVFTDDYEVRIPRTPIKEPLLPPPLPYDASAVQYLEAGYMTHTPVFGEYPVINAVTSRAQLARDFDFSKGYVDSGFVKSYLPQYDDDFFKSKSLIILSLLEGTGGTKHKVLHIDDNGDIVISRAIGDAIPIRPCPWTIIIPISKDSKLEKYNVVIRDNI